MVSSYVTHYPILRIAQSALHFISVTDLFNQTTSLGIIQPHAYAAINARRLLVSIARYSFIQLSELEQYKVKQLTQGFNTPAQDSNPDSLSCESEALPLSHCALRDTYVIDKSHHFTRDSGVAK